jgi:DNA-binding response OmpR family regulator
MGTVDVLSRVLDPKLWPAIPAMFAHSKVRRRSQAIPTKQHLLFIDDEPAIRALATLELERKGYRVTATGNAGDALWAIENRAISLVILDLNMPGMDGLTLLAKIKRQHHGIPVVILTGARFDEASQSKAKRNGADGFISKGFSIDELISEISKHCS